MKRIGAATVQFRELHPYVFCDGYRVPKGPTNKYQLTFSKPEGMSIQRTAMARSLTRSRRTKLHGDVPSNPTLVEDVVCLDDHSVTFGSWVVTDMFSTTRSYDTRLYDQKEKLDDSTSND